MENKTNKLYKLNKLKIECLVSVSPKKKIRIVKEDTSDKIKRLSRSIGITSKHVCDKGQRFSTLGETGINFILNNLNLAKDEIDGIVVVTQSPDYIMPGTAVLLQDRCGFPKSTLAYDINLGCSGYPYALYVAYGHLLSGMKRVLIVVGDQIGHVVAIGCGSGRVALRIARACRPVRNPVPCCATLLALDALTASLSNRRSNTNCVGTMHRQTRVSFCNSNGWRLLLLLSLLFLVKDEETQLHGDEIKR